MERGSWQVMAGKGAGDGAAQEAGHAFWRLFDLVVRTPRLEIRLPREEEFGALLAVIAAGVHDPATMPFTTPFTDRHFAGARTRVRPMVVAPASRVDAGEVEPDRCGPRGW